MNHSLLLSKERGMGHPNPARVDRQVTGQCSLRPLPVEGEEKRGMGHSHTVNTDLSHWQFIVLPPPTLPKEGEGEIW